MAKKKKNEATQELKPLVITSAAVTDGFCNYSYEVKDKIGKGDVHSVKGKGIIDDDMGTAFHALSVHLAVIDDIFKHSDHDVINVAELRKSELSALYTVTGFKIKGQEDHEQVILVGNKEISCSGGFMSIETPKIPLDEHSSYRWASELKEAINNARLEVELYREGKYTEVEPEEKENANQLKITADVDMEDGRV